MRILGISCFYHDAAAALLVDGQLVAAAEEERFSRVKHDSRWPAHAIDFCLATGGLRPDDLDCVVFYEKPLLKFERVLLSAVSEAPRSIRFFREAMISSLLDRLWVKAKLRGRFGLPGDRLLFCEHHLSHAASAFYCSPFEEAAVLTVDGVGEWTTAALGVGKDTTLRLTDELRFPHSLGLLYSAFTAWLGFEVNEGEYKVMGMAPYGQPKYVDKVYEVVQVDQDGGLQLDMSYFSFHQSVQRTYSPKFEALLGPPRDPKQEDVEPYYADVAASIQQVCEETMLAMSQCLYDRTGLSNLCLAGGVALNSVANGRIAREGPFERVFIQPAAGDGGGALGAALWAQHAVFGQPRTFMMDHAYWGQAYAPAEIRAALDAAGVTYRDLGGPEAVQAAAVERLAQGQVLGWFQERFEYGPRALGARSIIADPRREDIKDVVNRKIKFREPFRPFAPSVSLPAAGQYFDLAEPETAYPARFMLYVVDVLENSRERLPAITHVDGTARPQTVDAAVNPRYAGLIEQFEAVAGLPVILNTSFNLRGEPIVNTPADALSTFERSGLDALVLGDFLVTR
ncbi:MAG: hypothetical protein CL878_08635 [Dehalococcoidia bacterium]|nr:hypothetical protein [Dehalococcoidia bacterium]